MTNMTFPLAWENPKGLLNIPPFSRHFHCFCAWSLEHILHNEFFKKTCSFLFTQLSAAGTDWCWFFKYMIFWYMMNYIELQYPQYDITGIMVCKRNHPHIAARFRQPFLAGKVHPDQGKSNSYFQVGELLYIIWPEYRMKPGLILIDFGFDGFFLVQPASNTVPMTVDYRLSKMLSSSSLTGGLEHDFYFSIQLGISSSQLLLTPSFFRGVGLNHQPVV